MTEDYKFQSTNPTSASVSEDGTVTGLAAGTGDILVTTSDGSYRGKMPFEIVASSDYIPTTGISLNKTNITLRYAYGSSSQLKATVSPANATSKVIEWTSSDPEAVSCVGGYVKCLRVRGGTFTVTAKAKDGQTATCNVTIEQNGTLITGVSPSTINCDGEEQTKHIEIETETAGGYSSGYSVLDTYGYTRAINKTPTGFDLVIKRNPGNARTIKVYVSGSSSGDTTKTITVNQAYSKKVAGLAYSSTHPVKGWVTEGGQSVYKILRYEDDTTYFLADQGNPADKDYGTSYRHVYDGEGTLISGGYIIYVDCAPDAFDYIYRYTESNKPWLHIRFHEYRSDVGGMIGIYVDTNTTGEVRSGRIIFPGGYYYDVQQDA